MDKTTVDIKGMHCRSCEILVEDELLKVPGVCKAVVNQHKGTAEIFHKEKLNSGRVEQAIANAGYALGKDEKPWLSKNPQDFRDLAIGIFILFDLYIMARYFGLFNLNLAGSNNYSSLPIVFLIGITAGLSTCMALVGGLVLGASARFAEKHPTSSTLAKFKPHLFFNLGRIISFFILGGAIGFAGSLFQLSTGVLGILTIIVGGVMFLLGLQLTEISPASKSINFSLPKSIAKTLGIKQDGQEYTDRGSMMMGAMTFFLPCGFTQAMQLFAISSGNIITGSLTMGVFAIGTAPGLLGIGGLTSVVKGTLGKLFFKTAGVVVLVLAIFNISNGYNLSGLNFGGIFNTIFSVNSVNALAPNDPNVSLVNGVQEVRMAQDYSGYHPNSFVVKKGIPVKWIIDSKDPNTCASSIVSSKLGIRKNLDAGENVFEFTPAETGQIKFTCIMGMFSGSFNVVDGNNDGPTAAAPTQPSAPTTGGGCGTGKQGGCGGCGSGTKPQPNVPAAPEDQAKEGNVQVIKATYTYKDDIRPNSFTLKAGQPARLEVAAKENGSGCMGSITVPGLTNKIDLLTAGKTTVFEFIPKAGTYQITCAMGVPRGQIKVN